MKPRPIILCSGGIDSLALTVMAVTRGLNPLLLHIRYDHPAAREELEAVRKIASAFAGSCKLHLDTFIHALNILIKDGVGVAAPLINMTRKQILVIIPEPIQYLAWSCYQPYCGVPCGRCNSCLQGN